MNDGIYEVEVNGQREFVRATDQDHANRIAAAMSSKVQESTQKIEDDFRDMMPTSEEFYAPTYDDVADSYAADAWHDAHDYPEW